uniref:Uncharacterized protein n=1 Tax=Timema poppense TaxID=170557 RepID=A0A7R9D7B3_TIMPO|nr:unnamed protein product [Timema poppensis]
MPSNSVSTLALLSSLLAAALCGATAEAPRGTLMAQSEDGILLPASMNDLDDLSVVEEDFEQVSRGRDPTVGGNKEQSLSSLYQLLQAALHQNQLQQQQGRRLEEAGSETLYPVLPAAVPLIRQPDGLNKDEDKRGSYMSLCHFKICNMGRKRNLRGTFWPRIWEYTIPFLYVTSQPEFTRCEIGGSHRPCNRHIASNPSPEIKVKDQYHPQGQGRTNYQFQREIRTPPPSQHWERGRENWYKGNQNSGPRFNQIRYRQDDHNQGLKGYSQYSHPPRYREQRHIGTQNTNQGQRQDYGRGQARTVAVEVYQPKHLDEIKPYFQFSQLTLSQGTHLDLVYDPRSREFTTQMVNIRPACRLNEEAKQLTSKQWRVNNGRPVTQQVDAYMLLRCGRTNPSVGLAEGGLERLYCKMSSFSLPTLALAWALLAAAGALRGSLVSESEEVVLPPVSLNGQKDVVDFELGKVFRSRIQTIGDHEAQSLSSLYQLLQAALHQKQQKQGRRMYENESETLYSVLPAAVILNKQSEKSSKHNEKRRSLSLRILWHKMTMSVVVKDSQIIEMIKVRLYAYRHREYIRKDMRDMKKQEAQPWKLCCKQQCGDAKKITIVIPFQDAKATPIVSPISVWKPAVSPDELCQLQLEDIATCVLTKWKEVNLPHEDAVALGITLMGLICQSATSRYVKWKTSTILRKHQGLAHKSSDLPFLKRYQLRLYISYRWGEQKNPSPFPNLENNCHFWKKISHPAHLSPKN